MKHITRTQSAKDSSGNFKSLDQLMRSQMTVLQYGRYVAAQQKAMAANA